MFRALLALFIIVPALEIWLLLSVVHWIGGWQTFLLVLLSSVVGAYLAKREFRRIWAFASAELSGGRVPAGSLLDGICVLAGGLLLLLPGFLTDIAGILLLLPQTRRLPKLLLVRLLQKQAARGAFRFFRR